MPCENQSYKLGRGKLFFSRAGDTAFRYVGNTPEFNLTIASDTLDHYCSDGGLKEKDFSIELTTDRTGNFITDNIVPENMALFFFGSSTAVTTVAAIGLTETLTGVKKDLDYKLGVTPTEPAGVFGVDPATIIVKTGVVTHVVGVDYTIDGNNGILHVITTGAIANADNLDITYDLKASTRDRMLSGTQPVQGRLMYVESNPKGVDFTYIMPLVKITPNGDITLKGDEFQQVPFNIEILKPSGQEAIYIDGAPAYA